MTQEPQEKWQIALSKWDKWNASINNVKAHIQSKYGDVAQLLANHLMKKVAAAGI